MTTLKPLIAVLGLLTLAACEKPAHPDAMMGDDAMMSGGEAMMSDGDAMMSDGDTMMSGG